LRLYPGYGGRSHSERPRGLISFGRPFISNPDLVERFANGWLLNPPADMAVWFSSDSNGYTDFPRYEALQGKPGMPFIHNMIRKNLPPKIQRFF
jgi:hypothetical protein